MPEPRRVVLALDQGGHGSRACLVDELGRIVRACQVAIATERRGDECVQHDAAEVMQSLRTAATQVLRDAQPLQIVAAGLATQRSTVVCFDRHDAAPLSPALSWQDRRNAAWLAGYGAHTERIGAITGLPLSAHYGVSKMRWCLDHLPAVQQARREHRLVLAPLACFVSTQLCGGEAVTDPANAARTLLWDSALHDWSAPLLQLFDIERELLPRSGATCGNFGALRLPTGPRYDIPLRAVTGDQSAVAFAYGAPDTRTVYINLGTGAFIQRPLATRPARAAPLLGSVLAADAGHALYSLEGTVNGAGSAISALLESSPGNEAALWQGLEQPDAVTAPPIYVNGIGGLGSPYWRAEQRSYFIGDGPPLQRFAAVLESIVFLVGINFELLRALDAPVREVLVSGGLSRSNWLCQRLAERLGVRVTRGAHEATVLGVAALAAPSGWGQAWAQRQHPCFEPGRLSAQQRAALAQRRARFEAELVV